MSRKYSVIDNNKNIEYRECKTDISRRIGLSVRQISRLEEKAIKEGRNREIFNHFEILFLDFKETNINSGFKNNPENIYKGVSIT